MPIPVRKLISWLALLGITPAPGAAETAAGITLKLSYDLGMVVSEDSTLFEVPTSALQPLSVLGEMTFSGHDVSIPFESGRARLDALYLPMLWRLLSLVPTGSKAHLHVIGHASPGTLNLIALSRYGDADGLALARAIRAAQQLSATLNLPMNGISVEGRGQVARLDDNEDEAIKRQGRRVQIQLWHKVLDR